MTRIITQQEETHYELAANSESLDFWKTLGFRIIETGEREDEFYLRKTCSFGIRQQLGGLAAIKFVNLHFTLLVTDEMQFLNPFSFITGK